MQINIPINHHATKVHEPPDIHETFDSRSSQTFKFKKVIFLFFIHIFYFNYKKRK